MTQIDSLTNADLILQGSSPLTTPNGLIVTKHQARFTVHRQSSGTFTPIVFDVSMEWNIEGKISIQETASDISDSILSTSDLTKLARIINNEWLPFTKQSLFVDVDSPFLVELLKGPSLGFNRKDEMDKIRAIVAEKEIWNSMNQVPPITTQNQRIVCYDVEEETHGSMLDPANVVFHVASQCIKGYEGLTLAQATIIDGFVHKQL